MGGSVVIHLWMEYSIPVHYLPENPVCASSLIILPFPTRVLRSGARTQATEDSLPGWPLPAGRAGEGPGAQRSLQGWAVFFPLHIAQPMKETSWLGLWPHLGTSQASCRVFSVRKFNERAGPQPCSCPWGPPKWPFIAVDMDPEQHIPFFLLVCALPPYSVSMVRDPLTVGSSSPQDHPHFNNGNSHQCEGSLSCWLNPSSIIHQKASQTWELLPSELQFIIAKA